MFSEMSFFGRLFGSLLGSLSKCNIEEKNSQHLKPVETDGDKGNFFWFTGSKERKKKAKGALNLADTSHRRVMREKFELQN